MRYFDHRSALKFNNLRLIFYCKNITIRKYTSRASSNHILKQKEELLHRMNRLLRKTTDFKFSLPHKNKLMIDKGLEQFLKRSNEANNLKDFDGTYLPDTFGSNQNIPIDPAIERELNLILSHFQAPIDFAFGYGSGVFKQNGYDNLKGSNKPQIDLIFGVKDPLKFHKINMCQNPDHYSSLKWCGSSVISYFQDIGAGIYFNPFVDIAGREVKYGVVSLERIVQDLCTWDSFYLAGRLQKPVKILKDNNIIKYWNQLNLKSAATVAKYLLHNDNTVKSRLDEFKFYQRIAGLSYIGDIRYTLGGENPNKVNNIVEKNFHNFQKYYGPIYEDVVFHNRDYLPLGYSLDNCLKTLGSHIQRTSILQTLKGIATAGATKSFKYAWSKKMKAWKGK